MSSTYKIEPKNRDSGDYSDTEGILRFRRIRVERQEILLGDSDPMICLYGQDIIVAGKGGGLVKSHDGGISWGTTRTIPGMLPDDKLCALGVDANDRLMGATWSEEALSIQFSDDGAVTFGSPVTVHAPAGPGAEAAGATVVYNPPRDPRVRPCLRCQA